MASPDRSRFDVNKRPTLIAVSNADGETPVTLWADPNTHQLLTSGTGGGGSGDGALLDGVNATIKATVFSLTNAKPLATQIVDATGTAITSFGGGTQYADGAAAATPTGTQVNWNNAGTQASVSLVKPLPVQFTDGTNVASVLKSDGTAAGQNAAVVSGTGMMTTTITLSSGTPNTNWYDMLNYAWVSIEILTNTTPATLTFQTSGDAAQTNIRTMTLVDSQNAVSSTTPAQPATSTTSATGTFHGPRVGRYFRISSNNGAGTTTLVITFYTQPSNSLAIGAVVSAAHAIGSTAPANAFYMGINSGGNLSGITAPTADGLSATAGVGSLLMGYNGATWDRMRGDTTNGLFVQVKAQVPGTAATNLGKAEDAAHVTGDTGVAIWTVRNDGGATTFTNANGDYNPIASDGTGSVHVVQKSQTATTSSVSGVATSTTLLAANNNRKGAQIYNDSTAILYVKLGATASTSSFTVPLAAGAYYELPAGYVGIIDGIWVSATGAARITEET